jgi:hypothetical protein
VATWQQACHEAGIAVEVQINESQEPVCHPHMQNISGLK